MFPVQDKTLTGTKYVSRSRAVVVDNKDPQKRGRIQVHHPLFGESVWINYLRAPGSFDVPSVGDVVYVEADAGFETYLIASGNIVMGEEGDPQIPETFQRDDPTNRGFFTPGGHLVELDDGDSLTGSGSGVKITTAGGTKVHVEDDNDAIVIQSNFGDKLSVSKADGIQAFTPAGATTSLSMKSGEVTVTAGESSINITANSITVTDSVGGELNINNGKVALGGPTAEVVDILYQFLQELSTDVFSGFGAPAGKAAIYAQLALKLQTIKS